MADACERGKAVDTMKKTRNIRGNKADKRMDVGGEDGYPNRSFSGAEEEKVIDSFVRVRANVAERVGERGRKQLVE